MIYYTSVVIVNASYIMKTISSLFASAAHVIKDRLFKEADHHEYGDDIVVIYKRRIKYYINLSAYCREKLCA